jgi:hypothetical protein
MIARNRTDKTAMLNVLQILFRPGFGKFPKAFESRKVSA